MNRCAFCEREIDDVHYKIVFGDYFALVHKQCLAKYLTYAKGVRSITEVKDGVPLQRKG